MTTPGTEMGRSGNTVDTGATGRTGEVGGPGGGEVGGPGGGERDVTIGRLDGAQIDLLEPLWRSLIDHIRELGSVVSLVPHEQSWPRRRAIYQELFADGESFALAAWRGEQLVGYAMIHIAPPDAVWFTGSRYAELTSLCLAPAERGDGLGHEAGIVGVIDGSRAVGAIVNDLVAVAAQPLGEQRELRALSRAVLAHDGVDLALVDGEIDAFKDFPAFDAGVEIADFKKGHNVYLPQSAASRG